MSLQFQPASEVFAQIQAFRANDVNNTNITTRSKERQQRLKTRLCVAQIEFVKQYIKFVENAVSESIKLMLQTGRKHVMVNIPFHHKFEHDGFSILLHNVHYGGYGFNSAWRNRAICKTFDGLFRKIQQKLFVLGYFLLDESDCTKSNIPHFKLYCTMPTNYNDRYALWHGYNIIKEC